MVFFSFLSVFFKFLFLMMYFLELYYICRMINCILCNAALADSFFYTNDLSVLADVIIRELNDLPATDSDAPRELFLLVLESYLKKTEFRKSLYRAKHLCTTLSQFDDYEDKHITETANRLLLLINDFLAIKDFASTM